MRVYACGSCSIFVAAFASVVKQALMVSKNSNDINNTKLKLIVFNSCKKYKKLTEKRDRLCLQAWCLMSQQPPLNSDKIKFVVLSLQEEQRWWQWSVSRVKHTHTNATARVATPECERRQRETESCAVPCRAGRLVQQRRWMGARRSCLLSEWIGAAGWPLQQDVAPVPEVSANAVCLSTFTSNSPDRVCTFLAGSPPPTRRPPSPTLPLQCMMGSFRRPRPRFMSSPVLSDLARFHASSPALQLSNTSVWNRWGGAL